MAESSSGIVSISKIKSVFVEKFTEIISPSDFLIIIYLI